MLRVFYGLLFYFLMAGNSLAQNSFIDQIEQLKDSLVDVKTVYVRVIGDHMASFERNGTGIVIDPSGLIVTNTHVIINAPHIFVMLRDGTKLEAQVAFISPLYDFSFLKVDPARPLRPIHWADSSKVQLGQEITAIGNSDYDHESLLAGQIVGVVQSRSKGTNEFLKLDLNLYRGDSGGPILDHDGKLLGIVMAKQKSEEHASFAIASNKILEQYLIYRRKMQ